MFNSGDKVMIVNVPATSCDASYNGALGMAEEICVACTFKNAFSHGEKTATWHVRLVSGQLISIAERYLRKIDGDEDGRKVVGWDCVPWKPQQVTA